jgi:hypothetical protein
VSRCRVQLLPQLTDSACLASLLHWLGGGRGFKSGYFPAVIMNGIFGTRSPALNATRVHELQG